MASTERGLYYFDFDTIIEDAQKRVIQEGKHPPMAFLEGGKGLMETELPEFPESHKDKLESTTALGQLAVIRVI